MRGRTMIPEELESAIGYTFNDKSLLERALTLSSAERVNNNEILEFFGDAILEFIVSEKLFSDGGTEGVLTERRKSLVSDTALAPVSEKLGIDRYLIRGKADNFNKKAVPSAYEALTAAIYLDGGMDAAKKFVLTTLDFSGGRVLKNYKGELQEILQGSGEAVPEYARSETGTPQNPVFFAEISVFGKTFRGTGENAKSAEQQAAKAALEYYVKSR